MRRSTPEQKARVEQHVRQKLTAFEEMQTEFEASFRFIQNAHGQKRFQQFPVIDVVRYLHARWICECKGRLLSVAKTVKEYDGQKCLLLLRQWQEGDTASVVEFLCRKLDMLPLPYITRQISEALKQEKNVAQRLLHGRQIMLNRGFNLMHALDAIFERPEEEVIYEVRQACEHYGHLPVQLEQQLAEMDSPLFAFVPHQILAQRNMMVMNALGVDVTIRPTDWPGNRTWRVIEPTEPLRPYAEQVIVGYQELVLPMHNNVRKQRFVDRVEHSEDGAV